jgi:hypothetical protein
MSDYDVAGHGQYSDYDVAGHGQYPDYDVAGHGQDSESTEDEETPSQEIDVDYTPLERMQC